MTSNSLCLSLICDVFFLRVSVKVVRNKKIEIFSHRCLIEVYETNRMSHVKHLYDIAILLK